MKKELVKALLEIVDEYYGENLSAGVIVTYIGQGMYGIRITDRNQLVKLANAEENDEGSRNG